MNSNGGWYSTLTGAAVSRPIDSPSPQSAKWPGCVRIGPSARANGTLLRYDQAIDRARTCCVTFAGVAYHDDRT